MVEVPSATLPSARGLEKQLAARLAALELRPVTIRAAAAEPASNSAPAIKTAPAPQLAG